MVEIDSVGGFFTQSNGTRERHMRLKLDRLLNNDAWILKWPNTKPTLLHGTTSDHAVLLIELVVVERGKNPFKMYNSYIWEEGF